MIHGYLMQEKSSRTSLYLEDIQDHPDHPDGYQDAWSHLNLIPEVMKFPKIYDI